MKLDITLLLLLFTACAAAGVVANEKGPGQEVASGPNVIWIIADDLSPDLGCYGYLGVATPNIDRLAGDGTRYLNAFATAPVCSSSRSALITGVYQTTTGTHQHRTVYKRSLPGDVQPITSLMRRAGYYVCNTDSTMRKRGKTDYNFLTEENLYDLPDWSSRKSGQPFFAQIQIHEPHRSFDTASSDRRDREFSIPSYYPDHPVIRADWANYLATVEQLDTKVGRILDRLQRDGDADETVVFFFGDHGRPHYRGKQWLYDSGIQVPLIVRWPKRLDPGAESRLMVSLIDVPAATLSIAGQEVPDWMHGKDFLSDSFTGRDFIFAARDRCGSTVDRIRCIRSERFKYIRNYYPGRPYWQHSGYKELQYPGMTVARLLHRRGELKGPPAIFWTSERPTEELYDLQSDPEEIRNLAGDAKHKQTLIQLREKLDRWTRETGDRGGELEQRLTETIEASESWYNKAMGKRGFPPRPDPERYLRWWEEQLGIR